ncbi:uncharacterized protein LOC135221228 [Macrobrachium nipponense]|uniref:uncharacterized protein LOC135221228 n=1 Tax=Macrobrachium nipponense TaxID=159736 RepID=UPI0030C82C3D
MGLDMFGNCYGSRKRVTTVGLDFLFLLSLVMGLLGSGNAEMPQVPDCEIINPTNLPERKVTITFDKSLFLTILANQRDSWNVSTTLSDTKGLECSFGFGRRGGKRNEYFVCSEEHAYNATANERRHEYVTAMTHVAVDVEPKETCAFHFQDKSTSCHGSFRITFPQLLSMDGYATMWWMNLLKPPLTMRVDQVSGASLAFNCKNPDCLQTSGELEDMKSQRNTFFMKPATSFRGLTISSGQITMSVTRDNLSVYEDSWFNITLAKEREFSKVLVNGAESYREQGDAKTLLIKSVQANGSALLSWCDPREEERVSGLESQTLLMYRISTALLLFIITVLFVIACCLAKEHRQSQNNSGVLQYRLYKTQQEKEEEKVELVLTSPGVQDKTHWGGWLSRKTCMRMRSSTANWNR